MQFIPTEWQREPEDVRFGLAPIADPASERLYELWEFAPEEVRAGRSYDDPVYEGADRAARALAAAANACSQRPQEVVLTELVGELQQRRAAAFNVETVSPSDAGIRLLEPSYPSIEARLDAWRAPKPAMAVEHFRSLRDLRSVLYELASEVEPRYPLCCCLLYARGQGRLGRALSDFMIERFEVLDYLTDDDVLVFIPDDRTRRDTEHDVLDVARHLGIRFGSLPCALFFLPGRERSDRLIVKLSALIPDTDAVRELRYAASGDEDRHVAYTLEMMRDKADLFMRVVADAARLCAQLREDERLPALRMFLASQLDPDDPGENVELRQNVGMAASVLTLLLEAAKWATGSG